LFKFSFQAFDKSSSKFKEPGVKFVLITKANEDIALRMAREYFITQEPMNICLGMKWTEEVEEYWKRGMKTGLSLMFLHDEDDDPIAFQIIEIVRFDDICDIEGIQYQGHKDLVRCLADCDRNADFFGHFQTKEAFHFLSLGVTPKYGQRGYGTKIFNFAIDFVRNFEIDPVYIKVEGSSNFSKKIFERAGMEILHEKYFEDWEFEGRKPFQNTGIHKSLKLYGLKLPAK
jgi:RimJ/RimL family protein N-acetyltransferase